MGAHQAPAAVFCVRLPHPLSGRWTDGPLAGAPVLTALHPGFRDRGWPTVVTAGCYQRPVLVPADGDLRQPPGTPECESGRDGLFFTRPGAPSERRMQPRAPLPAPTTRRLELRPLVRARMGGSVRHRRDIVKENNPMTLASRTPRHARDRPRHPREHDLPQTRRGWPARGRP
jgi:hypothetical protein